MHDTDPHSDMTTTSSVDRVVVLHAGDSGDGVQLAGDRFTAEAAAFGNDLLGVTVGPRGGLRSARSTRSAPTP